MNTNIPSLLGKVAVLFGGRSAERAVSLKSGQAVLNALLRCGVDAYPWDPAEQSLEQLRICDRAFIVLHGRGGEDGCIQGVLEWLRIPYTGSGVMASALGMDKMRTKQIWLSQGLPTPGYERLLPGFDSAALVAQWGLPLMIKPVHEGSSLGMSRVDQADALGDAFTKAFALDELVIAEQFIHGQEYTIPILGAQALPVIRLETPHRFYDYEAKYQAQDTRYVIPCGLNVHEEQQLQELALAAFAAVDARGWGRIDVMRDTSGAFWLLEINTVPGMTDHSLVPMAAQAAGLDFDQLCLKIVEQTLL